MIKTCTYNKSPVESISSDENKWDPPLLKQPPILPPFLSEKSEPSFLRKFEKRDHSPPTTPAPSYKTRGNFNDGEFWFKAGRVHGN